MGDSAGQLNSMLGFNRFLPVLRFFAGLLFDLTDGEYEPQEYLALMLTERTKEL